MKALQEVNTTYEPFSLEPEYVEANRGFVQGGNLRNATRILDLACGTGTVSELLLESAPAANLNGIDLDSVQIDLSVERFNRLGYQVRRTTELSVGLHDGKPVLSFAAGSADDLPFEDGVFDVVTMANAIHMVPGREKLLAGISRVLKPGGVFGFNSTFYSGAMPEGTQRIYVDWLQMASDYIRAKSAERQARGEQPIKRVRGTGKGAFKNRWYGIEEWSEALASAGLEVNSVNERPVVLDARCLGLVGAYGGLAEVLLSGFPVAEASEALQVSADLALTANKCTSIARNYLEIWSIKK